MIFDLKLTAVMIYIKKIIFPIKNNKVKEYLFLDPKQTVKNGYL